MLRRLLMVAVHVLALSCGGDPSHGVAESIQRGAAADDGTRTFGYDTLDGFAYQSHNWPLGNNEQVQQATISEAGTLVAIRTFFRQTTFSPDSPLRVRAIIYADASGEPGALLGVTAELSDLVAGAWRDFPFASPIDLAPGTYWIGIWGDQSREALSRAGDNRYKPWTYSSTGSPMNPWRQDGALGVNGGVVRPICGVYLPRN